MHVQGRLKTAARWRMRIEADPQRADLREFQQWLADPQNRRSFQRVGATLDELQTYAAQPRMLRVQGEAVSRALRASVARRRRLITGARIGVAALVVIVAAGLLFRNQPATYATRIGEHRVVTLTDGSRIWLDSMTQVQVRYSARTRAITLLQGRASFEVAHNATRPFTVTAAAETVVATGTAFNVELVHSNVVVTLTKGRVLVTAGTPRDGRLSRSVSLKVGQELVVSQAGQLTLSDIDIQTANSWQSGRLLFNDEPLAEAVDRINRYQAQQIRVDPAVAELRVSGVFNADEPGTFVHAVTAYFPVRSRMLPGGRILLEKRP